MVSFVFGVVLARWVDLNGRILRINLAFDETLQSPWHPNIETDLTVD